MPTYSFPEALLLMGKLDCEGLNILATVLDDEQVYYTPAEEALLKTVFAACYSIQKLIEAKK